MTRYSTTEAVTKVCAINVVCVGRPLARPSLSSSSLSSSLLSVFCLCSLHTIRLPFPVLFASWVSLHALQQSELERPLLGADHKYVVGYRAFLCVCVCMRALSLCASPCVKRCSCTAACVAALTRFLPSSHAFSSRPRLAFPGCCITVIAASFLAFIAIACYCAFAHAPFPSPSPHPRFPSPLESKAPRNRTCVLCTSNHPHHCMSLPACLSACLPHLLPHLLLPCIPVCFALSFAPSPSSA